MRISRIRLSSGIMPLAQRSTGSERSLTVPAALRCPGSQKLHGFTRGAPLRPAAEPVHASAAPSRQTSQPGPFAYACDASGLSALSGGDRRQSHSRGPSPLRHLSTPEAPFLDGRYPASSVLRASPPPCRPSLPLAGSRSPRARHRQGFPCCYAFHLPCMPAPIPRRKPAGAFVALFPAGLPPITGGSASALSVSRPARRSLAFRPAWSLSHPSAALLSKELQPMSLPP